MSKLHVIQGLVIFDDIIFNPRIVKVAAEFFTRGCHKNVSLIFCTQNSFLAFLLLIRDTGQVSLFGKTFLNNDKIADFIALFKRLAYEEGDYGYLLIDYTKFSESLLALRTHIFEDAGCERAHTLDFI